MNDGVFTRCKFCRSRMRMKTFVAWPFCPRLHRPSEAAQRQETRNCLLINVTKKIAQRNESGGGEKGR